MSMQTYNLGQFPEHLPNLKNIYDDLFSGGKGIRSDLISCVARPLKLPEKEIQLLCQCLEYIHNASLLHDDLVDRSPLRRKRKSAWLKYSPEYAVLAGDYLLAQVMVSLADHGNLPLIQYTAKIVQEVLEGEWLQDQLCDRWDVSLEELDHVCCLKTGTLFNLCLITPFICLEKSSPELESAIRSVGHKLGLLFQRSDDLIDFNIRNKEQKSSFTDLKARHLNSFGIFLRDCLSQEEFEKLKACTSKEDMGVAVPLEKLHKALEAFDKSNDILIEECLRDIEAIEPFLKDSEKVLIEDLKRYPSIFCWR